MMNELVNTIMTTDLVTISPDDRLDNVRKVFMDNAVHHLPVVNEGKIVGIVTTYDIWKNEIAPQDYATTEVQEIMTTQIAKIGPNDKIGTAAELFLDKRFHALPIVDDENNLLGIVSSFDVLLYEYKKEYPNPILYKHLFIDNEGQQRMAT